MHLERLADRVGDRAAWVERRVRILEHDLHVASSRAQLSGREVHEFPAVERDVSGGGLEQPEHQTRHGRLARAALADETERLALVEVEVDAVDRAYVADHALEEAAVHGKRFAELAYRELRCARRVDRRPRSRGFDLVACLRPASARERQLVRAFATRLAGAAFRDRPEGNVGAATLVFGVAAASREAATDRDLARPGNDPRYHRERLTQRRDLRHRR